MKSTSVFKDPRSIQMKGKRKGTKTIKLRTKRKALRIAELCRAEGLETPLEATMMSSSRE